MNKRILLGITFAVTCGCLGAAVDHVVMAAQQNPSRTMLLESDLPDIQGKEAKMWITEIAPGAVTPKHSHPGHIFAYVLEGSLIHQVEGHQPRTIGLGQSWQESPGEVHFAKNASATTRLRMLSVAILEKGKPLSTPAP